MKETVRITGLRETQAALRDLLPDRTARAVMKRVLLQRALPIAQTAVTLAPVKTGRLALNIIASTRLNANQRAGHVKPSSDDIEVFVGVTAKIRYAHLVEFGTKKTAARPFIRPAWDTHRTGTIIGIGASMDEEIKRAASRLARRAAK